MKPSSTVAFGALCLLTGVGAGAFGAHGLKQVVSPSLLAVWQTAVLYQLVHGLGLLILVALAPHLNAALSRHAIRLMAAGIVIFSGSLYALVLSGYTMLGAITPIGGVAFILAWALVAVAALQKRTL
ncbi:MAG: DUF423 domain-containing protein [Burkholderiaceae bacterium]|jgi:uncharacterized membrane protein YgdD (TMEM256/DUF423 family)